MSGLRKWGPHLMSRGSVQHKTFQIIKIKAPVEICELAALLLQLNYFFLHRAV